MERPSRHRSWHIRLAFFQIALMFGGGMSAEAVDLLLEDFESVPLRTVVTFESELREREAWQDVAGSGLSGWTEENLTTSVGDVNSGVLEFEGWRFVDKGWWTNTAGGQGRESFLNGIGIVAVADPDEWDDFGDPTAQEGVLDPSEGLFDATLKTPPVALGAAGSDPVQISFSSSWRDEDAQTATLMAIYDVGPAEPLATWTSDADDPDFKDDAENETLSYQLQAVPEGAATVQFEFRLQGNNDWWWAIDNLRVFTGDDLGEDGVLRAVIDRDTGGVQIVNNTGVPVSLRGYSLRSAAGSFDETAADFLSQGDAQWVQATQPGGDVNDLSEVNLSSFAFPAEGTIDLGSDSWIKYYEEAVDVTFDYLVAGNDEQIRGIVEFTGNGGEPFQQLDLNFDGSVDIFDWQTFKAGYGADLTDLTAAARYALSDIDGDGAHTLGDFTEFQRLFEVANGAGSFAAAVSSQAVPEPISLFFLVVGVGFLGWRRDRSRQLGLAIVCLLGLGIAFPEAGYGQLVLLDEDFEGLPDLKPWVEEDGSTKAGDVWTHTPPAGWTTDNSGVPGIGDPTTDGVLEWSNWSFVDKEGWIAADGQGREGFDFGSGNIMVADADEWDDQDGAARDPIASAPTPDNLYDVFATTSVINIPSSVPAGRIKLAFDSSWRGDEFQDDLDGNNNQTAVITAIYDGADRREVLRWDSDPEGENLNPAAENQRILELDLDFDGSASTLQLEFAMTDAWNDWWWAIDNVLISVPTDPAVLRINTATGQAFITGDDVISSSITGINVASPSGQLVAGAAGGLAGSLSETADGPDPGTTAGDSPGEQWELLASTDKLFAEAFLFGTSDFDDQRSELLGRLLDPTQLDDDPAIALQNSDLEFSYSLSTGGLVEGVVEYFFAAAPALPGDFNLDGVVDMRDYTVWRDNLGAADESSLNGNGDGGGVSDTDYDLWKSQFGSSAAATSGLAAASSVVPEPSSASLLLLAVSGVVLGWRRRLALPVWGSLLSCGLLSLVVISSSPVLPRASAQGNLPPAPVLDRFYGFGDDDSGATVGQPVTQTDGGGQLVTFDGAGQPNSNQLIDLLALSSTSRLPTYADTTDRPDGNGGIGLALNPLPFDRQYLRTGFGEALNYPEQSPSSLVSLVNPGGTLNYFRLNDRGFELWAKPTAVTGEHHIVMDSQQHGVLIKDGVFQMRYASRFEVETTQEPGADGELGTEDDILVVGEPVVTPNDVPTDVQAVANEWYHLAVVRPNGPANGSIFYVNGVAEAISFGTYAVEAIVNLGEGDVFTNIDSLDTSPLTVGRATDAESLALPVATSHFFRGVVDDLEMFVMGLNDNDNVSGGGNDVVNDWGEYYLPRDNDYVAAFAPSVDGDLNNDDAVTTADAFLFAQNWLFENQLQGFDTTTELVTSRRVGDLLTRSKGDFNYNGIVDLEDWAVLNNANPGVGAFALQLVTGAASLPEPASASLTLFALFVCHAWRERRRVAC